MNRLYGVVERGKILRTFSFSGPQATLRGLEPAAVSLPDGASPFTHFYCSRTLTCLPIPESPPGLGWEFACDTGEWVRCGTEAVWQAVRERRDALLAQSDWVTLRAQEQGVPAPPEWLAYRQALRDITLQPDPCGIDWPVPPG